MATNEILAKLTELGYENEGTLPRWDRSDIDPDDNPTGYDGAHFVHQAMSRDNWSNTK